MARESLKALQRIKRGSKLLMKASQEKKKQLYTVEGKHKSLAYGCWLSLPQPTGIISVDTITWHCKIEVEVIMSD